MITSFRLLAILIAVIVLAPPTYGAVQNQDEAQIRNVVMRQADTWNSHDATAYAALFTKDCDVVNVPGWWWKGRAELQHKLTAAFSTAFRKSKLTITDVQMRFLTPSVALAHARWTMVGFKMPPGMPEPGAGIQTLVLTKQQGQWLITGFQNTLTQPERPFLAEPKQAP